MPLAFSSPAWSDGTWSHDDVGAIGVPGSFHYDDGTGVYTIQGSGGDIWDNADAFQFVYQTVQGDGVLAAHFTSQEVTNPVARAGIMIRDTTDPGSINAFLAMAGNWGLNFQFRLMTDSGSSNYNSMTNGPPMWLKLIKKGDLVAGYESSDGITWTCRGVVHISFKASVRFGLAVSSHDNSVLSTSTFDHVTLTTSDSFTLPDPWVEQDVGAVSHPGGAYYDGGRWEIFGAGQDIWDPGDAFHYVYQPFNGDGTAIARVTGVMAIDDHTKAGLMFRESNEANSKYASCLLVPCRGALFQRRTDTGDSSAGDGLSALAPQWLKLVRQGDTFTAYSSLDQKNWKLIGKDTVKMPGQIEVGLAITSHNINRLSEASIDHFSITAGASSSPNP